MTTNDTANLLPTNPEEIDAYDLALDNMEQMENERDYPEDNLTDVEADAMTLAGAYGDPEDYNDSIDSCGGDW